MQAVAQRNIIDLKLYNSIRAIYIQKFLVERLKRYIRSISLLSIKRVRPLSRAQLLPLLPSWPSVQPPYLEVKKEAAEREREAARA